MAAMKQAMKSVAAPKGCALAPVRPAVARSMCFKPATVQQPVSSQRNVSAFVAAVGSAALGDRDDELIVSGSNKKQQEELLKLPKGYHWYETMLILRPTMSENDRDVELAKFEAFLNKQECLNINALVRDASRMAYDINRHEEGIYVVYTYAARRPTAQAVQNLLANPEVGSEGNVLRYKTFCKF